MMLNKKVQYIGILCALSLCLSLHPMAYAKDGMTWKKQSHNQNGILLGVDRVGCSGCDAYKGDTSCSTKLPILCLKKDKSLDPGVPILPCSGCSMPDNYYSGWAEGHIGLTFPVSGDKLAGVTDANDICEVQFGPGYRMGEFHDGKRQSGGYGGWNWYAYGNVNDSSRFWVYINDQSANCWGKGPGTSSDRDEAEILALLFDSDGGSCTPAELKAEYEKGYAVGYSDGAKSCETGGNCPNPTYQFDPIQKTGILTLPSIDIQTMNPLFPGSWSTQHDAFSAVMELMPGTSGYFYITDAAPKQPTKKDTTATE